MQKQPFGVTLGLLLTFALAPIAKAEATSIYRGGGARHRCRRLSLLLSAHHDGPHAAPVHQRGTG